MRRIQVITLFIGLLILASVSCNNEPFFNGDDNDVEIVEPRFFMETRADTNGDPEHGDTYSFVSYNVGGTSSNYNDKFQIANNSQFGYYAYNAVNKELVPVAIKFPDEKITTTFIPSTPFKHDPYYVPEKGINPLTKNPPMGLQLRPISETGVNPSNNTGIYHTAIIHPAIPFYNAVDGTLGHLAVYHIDTDVWASSPDDADGDPTTEDPFKITVKTNREVYPLPNPTELYPLKSLVNVSFYSEYLDDEDPDNPVLESQNFTIQSLKLVNVGSNGWYNARTGIVYPNYNYGPLVEGDNIEDNNDWRRFYYLNERGVKKDGSPINLKYGRYNYFDLLDPNHDGDFSDSKIVDERSNNKKPPQRPGYPDPQNDIQWSTEIPVYPSDYRGGENGGLSQVLPLSLRIVLDVNSVQLKATVPIAIVMERGKRYNFYLNVKSESIGIHYNVSSWEKVGTENDDPEVIGGTDDTYIIADIKYEHTKWQNGGGGSNEEIGDTKALNE